MFQVKEYVFTEEKIQGRKASKQKKKKVKSDKERPGQAGNVQDAQEKLRARIAELQGE